MATGYQPQIDPGIARALAQISQSAAAQQPQQQTRDEWMQDYQGQLGENYAATSATRDSEVNANYERTKRNRRFGPYQNDREFDAMARLAAQVPKKEPKRQLSDKDFALAAANMEAIRRQPGRRSKSKLSRANLADNAAAYESRKQNIRETRRYNKARSKEMRSAKREMGMGYRDRFGAYGSGINSNDPRVQVEMAKIASMDKYRQASLAMEKMKLQSTSSAEKQRLAIFAQQAQTQGDQLKATAETNRLIAEGNIENTGRGLDIQETQVGNENTYRTAEAETRNRQTDAAIANQKEATGVNRTAVEGDVTNNAALAQIEADKVANALAGQTQQLNATDARDAEAARQFNEKMTQTADQFTQGQQNIAAQIANETTTAQAGADYQGIMGGVAQGAMEGNIASQGRDADIREQGIVGGLENEAAKIAVRQDQIDKEAASRERGLDLKETDMQATGEYRNKMLEFQNAMKLLNQQQANATTQNQAAEIGLKKQQLEAMAQQWNDEFSLKKDQADKELSAKDTALLEPFAERGPEALADFEPGMTGEQVGQKLSKLSSLEKRKIRMETNGKPYFIRKKLEDAGYTKEEIEREFPETRPGQSGRLKGAGRSIFEFILPGV